MLTKNSQNDSSFKRQPKKLFYLIFIALFIDLAVIANAYLTIRIGPLFKFSVTLFIYFVAGYVLGGPLGFVVGVLSDVIGFFAMPDGVFNPYIVLASGLYAFIPGIMFGFKRPFNREISMKEIAVKGSLACFICYLLCTVIITSFGIWQFTSATSSIHVNHSSLLAWCVYRAGVQLPNTVVNCILSILIFIPLRRIKFMKNYL